MIATRARAKWIAFLCALGAISVTVIGVRAGVRFARESRAIAALRSQERAERETALEELAKLRSVRGVAEILSSLVSPEWEMRPGDRKWEDLCVRALGEIGLEAIPVLISKLDSPKSGERLYAIRFLWRVPELARERPGRVLLDLLDDSTQEVRDQAALALGCMALTDSQLLESLIDELKQMKGTEGRRVAAARAVGITAAPEQVADLLGSDRVERSAEGDSDSSERTATIQRAMLCLVQTLEDPSLRVRETCLYGLRKVLARAPPEIHGRLEEIVRRWLTHADPATRSLALDWLEDAFLVHRNKAILGFMLGKDVKVNLPRDVLDILGTLLLDPDPSVRWKSARYLGSPGAVPGPLADSVRRPTQVHR